MIQTIICREHTQLLTHFDTVIFIDQWGSFVHNSFFFFSVDAGLMVIVFQMANKDVSN